VAKCASFGSLLSGVIVGIGWYIFIDGLVQASVDCVKWSGHFNPAGCTNETIPDYKAPPGLVNGAYWTPGILSTLGLLGLNAISWDAVTDDFDSSLACKARTWVTVCFVLMFCGLGAAIWILASDLGLGDDYYHWGGVATLIQTMLILAGGLAFRLSRLGGEHAI